MSVDKINNSNLLKSLEESNKSKEVGDVSKFKSMLSEYLNEYNKLSENPDNSEKLAGLIKDKLLDSGYNSFSEVKLDNNNLNLDIRSDKIELAKKRLKEGFYLQDEILAESAGQIIDSLGI